MFLNPVLTLMLAGVFDEGSTSSKKSNSYGYLIAIVVIGLLVFAYFYFKKSKVVEPSKKHEPVKKHEPAKKHNPPPKKQQHRRK